MDVQQRSSRDVKPPPFEEEADYLSVEHLRHLIHVLDTSDVSEIEVKHAAQGTRLVLRKATASSGAVPNDQVVISPQGEEKNASSTDVENKYQTIVAPLVGIFHPWIKPKGKPLVAVGDEVKVGQLVGAIQSLNIIYEVETHVGGRVVEILVQDGQPIEYGQPLMMIDDTEEG
ncbi:MAG TPA: biotin/lipoyl-containing protein [Ktedonobacteraceae bacterium]